MKVMVSVLIFVATSTALSLLLSHIHNQLTYDIASLSLIFGLLCAIASYFTCRKKHLKFSKFTIFEYSFAFLFFLFLGRQFLWIYFLKDGAFRTLDVSNFGDLPLHLTYVAQFVRGAKVWPANPIFPYEKLHYPFGVDFFTALFVKLGAPLGSVLPLIGFGGLICTFFALLLWAESFGVGAFLFSGGLAGYAIFSSGILKDYQDSMAWKSIPMTLLIPQRGFLFAFPIGLVLLWSWRRRFLQNKEALPVWIEGTLFGTLPLIHFHTFFFLTILLATWIVATKNYRKAVPVFLWSIIPGTYLTFMITGFFKQSSLLWIEKGWMIKGQNVFWFFLVNYGFFVPLVLFATFLAFRSKSKDHLLLIVPALSFYFVFLFVMFAPWDWDNTKLMVWCYLLILPAIVELVFAPMKTWNKVVAYVILFFSGAVGLAASYESSNQGYEIAKQPELDYVCSALKDLKPDDIVATSQIYNHPVALCGQPIVAGYEGHLWSYGIQSAGVVTQLRLLLSGDPDWRKISEKLNVKYVFWGRREEKEFENSPLPQLLSTMKISESPWGKIYKVKEEK